MTNGRFLMRVDGKKSMWTKSPKLGRMNPQLSKHWRPLAVEVATKAAQASGKGENLSCVPLSEAGKATTETAQAFG